MSGLNDCEISLLYFLSLLSFFLSLLSSFLPLSSLALSLFDLPAARDTAGRGETRRVARFAEEILAGGWLRSQRRCSIAGAAREPGGTGKRVTGALLEMVGVRCGEGEGEEEGWWEK